MISFKTPTGKEFGFSINSELHRITITSESGFQFEYHLRTLKDLYIWLKNEKKRNWILLGTAGEETIPKPNTVEEWARSDNNPNFGFYGLTQGRRGRFASYVPSILECLGFVEIEHHGKNNHVRAL